MSAVRRAGRVAAGILPAAALIRVPLCLLALVAAVVFLFVLTLGTVRWVIASDDRTNRVIRMISARYGKSLPQGSPAAPARASRRKPADPPAAPARASRRKPADPPAAPARASRRKPADPPARARASRRKPADPPAAPA